MSILAHSSGPAEAIEARYLTDEREPRCTEDKLRRSRPLRLWERRQILDELDAAIPSLFEAERALRDGAEWARPHVARLRPLVQELAARLEADQRLVGAR